MTKFALTTIVFLALTASAFAKHHKPKVAKGEYVDWKNVPPAVQTTIQSNAAGGRVTEVRKEPKNGATVYRAEVKQTDGKMVQVAVNDAGKLMKVKVEEAKKKKHGFTFGI